jgi:DegV family protein with EDD domain
VARPTVLLIEPRAERLRELSHQLTAEGCEVVPLADLAKAQRFATGLESAVVVLATAALAGHTDPAAVLEGLDGLAGHGSGRSLVVLGDRPADEEDLPDSVAFLAVGGLDALEVTRRLLLVLLGRQIGVAPDARLASLVGDLEVTPLIGLLRALSQAGANGRIELRGGTLTFDRGAVVAATAGPARGLKAFCRLSRLTEGPLRFVPGNPSEPSQPSQPPGGAASEIMEDLHGLIHAAIEESLGELPDPRGKLEIDLKPAFFTTAFTAVQQQILSLAQRGTTLQQVLDSLPDRDSEIVQELLRLEDLGLVVRRLPAAAAQIVTDSTSDLPMDVARAHGIVIVPLTVAFGKEIFRDRIDLHPGRFYALLAERKEHPASSPPSRDDFAPRYREPLLHGDEVISLHISAKLSKTFENANAAAAAELAEPQRPGETYPRHVTVLDSGQVSLGLGLLALIAARLAARNEPAERIVRRLREMAPRVHTLFVVDTLEYLARGGRIGKARALLGGLLRIKPILGVTDGEIVPVDRVRGGRAVQPRLIELLHQRVDRQRPVLAGICHANAPAWADSLERLLRENFPITDLIQAEVGPVVGANVGPGAVGVMVFQPTEEELRWIAPL